MNYLFYLAPSGIAGTAAIPDVQSLHANGVLGCTCCIPTQSPQERSEFFECPSIAKLRHDSSVAQCDVLSRTGELFQVIEAESGTLLYYSLDNGVN